MITDWGYKSCAQIWGINGFALNSPPSEAWVLNFSYLIQVQGWCSKLLYTISGNVIAKEKLLTMSGTRLESILDQEMEMVFSLRFRCLDVRGVSSTSNTSTEFVLQVRGLLCWRMMTAGSHSPGSHATNIGFQKFVFTTGLPATFLKNVGLAFWECFQRKGQDLGLGWWFLFSFLQDLLDWQFSLCRLIAQTNWIIHNLVWLRRGDFTFLHTGTQERLPYFKWQTKNTAISERGWKHVSALMPVKSEVSDQL